MKKTTNQKRVIALIISVILNVVMVLNLASCKSDNTANVSDILNESDLPDVSSQASEPDLSSKSNVYKLSNLMDNVTANTAVEKNADDKFINNTADFSVNLFKKSITEKKNSLISPLSVLLALSMTANGADNQTLAQMEKVLGNDIPLSQLNQYIKTYIKNLPSEDKAKISIANSIWFRDGLNVENDFLQKNADYYNAGAFKCPFTNQTVKDINSWVNKNTDGMIDKIIDYIDSDSEMYLINAIMFSAQWQKVYEEYSISGGKFNAIDGKKQDVKFMKSSENRYLDDGKATGFIKPYYKNYSFVALLPNEGISINDYIKTLSGDGFINTIKKAQSTYVSANMPKFSYDYNIKLNDALMDLGMPDAFSGKADFSKMCKSESLNISEVLHKTFISVDENGTKAAAVTAVITKGCEAYVEDAKTVNLDRPFVYAIIDNKTNLPIFLGTLLSVNN